MPGSEVPEFAVDPSLVTSWTADTIPEESRAALAKEIHVVLPMDGWDELESLADDFPEQVYAQVGGEAEGEEEGEEWVFYCSGMTPDQALSQVLMAIPEGWTAKIVPVPPDRIASALIQIVRK